MNQACASPTIPGDCITAGIATPFEYYEGTNLLTTNGWIWYGPTNLFYVEDPKFGLYLEIAQMVLAALNLMDFSLQCHATSDGVFRWK